MIVYWGTTRLTPHDDAFVVTGRYRDRRRRGGGGNSKLAAKAPRRRGDHWEREARRAGLRRAVFAGLVAVCVTILLAWVGWRSSQRLSRQDVMPRALEARVERLLPEVELEVGCPIPYTRLSELRLTPRYLLADSHGFSGRDTELLDVRLIHQLVHLSQWHRLYGRYRGSEHALHDHSDEVLEARATKATRRVARRLRLGDHALLHVAREGPCRDRLP